MDLPAGPRTDESFLTPWDTMDPDEPAAVSVAAPYPADDQGEALVYRAPEELGVPEESTTISEWAIELVRNRPHPPKLLSQTRLRKQYWMRPKRV